jgi:phage terminase large subunit-like protein
VIVPLRRAATDPRLLGATITWRSRQLDMLDLFGDDALRLLVVAAGRQGGKTTAAGATGIWNATCRDDLDALMPRGRTRFVLLASPSEAQSRESVRVMTAMLEASPALRDLATVTADRIDFTLPSGARTAIRALPANPRSVRGMTASCVICDEAAHWNSQDAGLTTTPA